MNLKCLPTTMCNLQIISLLLRYGQDVNERTSDPQPYDENGSLYPAGRC